MKLKKIANLPVQEILTVAGELSGDNLGGWILTKLASLGNFHFFGAGGNTMRQAGVEILVPLEELSVVGITEVLFKYLSLRKKMAILVQTAVKRGVKHAILIDFPGFNLKLAEKLSAKGIACYQISSPQIWGWRYGRIEKIRKYIRTVLCFYPFEKEIYDRENVEAFYIGHPIVASLQKVKIPAKRKGSSPKIIALLPGSRPMEIQNLLPYMLELAEKFHAKHPHYIFHLSAASEYLAQLIKNYPLPDCVILQRRSAAEILSQAHAAVACSGTVTLECAYFKVPFFLVYKASSLSYHIGKRLMLTKYIGMPNIIMGREIVKEFWQHHVTVAYTYSELERIVLNEKERSIIKKNLAQVAQKLGDGSAAEKAAHFLAYKLQQES